MNAGTDRAKAANMAGGAFVEAFVSSTMSMDVARVGGSRLADLATDLLMIAIRMRDAEDLGEPASLRKLIGHYLRMFQDNCRAAGVSSEAVNDARYALVALLDETVLSVPGACRDYWLSQPLQLELFGEAIAGEEFYRRLERLCEDVGGNRDVIEVYVLALALGFHGKYRLEGPARRAALIVELGEKLKAKDQTVSEQLSPHGRRCGVGRARPEGVRSFLMYYGVALLCAAAVAATWAAVAWSNAAETSAAVRTIRTLLGR